MVPLIVRPVVIVQATDVRPFQAVAPTLRASLLTLNDKAITVGAEVLDLAVSRVEGLKRIAFSSSLLRSASLLSSACTYVRDTSRCSRTDLKVRERGGCEPRQAQCGDGVRWEDEWCLRRSAVTSVGWRALHSRVSFAIGAVTGVSSSGSSLIRGH